MALVGGGGKWQRNAAFGACLPYALFVVVISDKNHNISKSSVDRALPTSFSHKIGSCQALPGKILFDHLSIAWPGRRVLGS